MSLISPNFDVKTIIFPNFGQVHFSILLEKGMIPSFHVQSECGYVKKEASCAIGRSLPRESSRYTDSQGARGASMRSFLSNVLSLWNLSLYRFYEFEHIFGLFFILLVLRCIFFKFSYLIVLDTAQTQRTLGLLYVRVV